MKHPTQRERADSCVAVINKARAQYRRDVDTALGHLGTVLDESQTEPPEGSSDGSLDEETWNDYRALYQRVARHLGKPTL